MKPSLIITALVLLAPLPALAQEHGDHAHHLQTATAPVTAAAPTSAGHAADQLFDPVAMAQARALLAHENGGMANATLLVDRLELRPGHDAYAFEGEAWYGGDINRLTIKAEGEGEDGAGLEAFELQALYSRAISPYFNLQAGLRQDIRPRPRTTYAVLGVEGLAPYWFEVEAAVFLSDEGDLSARFEASQDFRLTNRVLLTPRAEIDLSAQDSPALNLRSGLTALNAGLRIHYVVEPRFAPYVGVEWERAYGPATHEQTSLVVGLRAFF